jgi:hypothetical protein
MSIRFFVCAATAAADDLRRSLRFPLCGLRFPLSLRGGALCFAPLRIKSTALELVFHYSVPCTAAWSCRRPASLCEMGAAEGDEERGANKAARAI